MRKIQNRPKKWLSIIPKCLPSIKEVTHDLSNHPCEHYYISAMNRILSRARSSLDSTRASDLMTLSLNRYIVKRINFDDVLEGCRAHVDKYRIGIGGRLQGTR